MDSDQGKLFIGGISWETTEEKLRDYFKSYGEVAETVIMKDRATGRARGFGFVIFSDPTVADRVVLEKHTIDGRTVSLSLGLSLSSPLSLSVCLFTTLHKHKRTGLLFLTSASHRKKLPTLSLAHEPHGSGGDDLRSLVWWSPCTVRHIFFRARSSSLLNLPEGKSSKSP